jgi:hypothetical protein
VYSDPAAETEATALQALEAVRAPIRDFLRAESLYSTELQRTNEDVARLRRELDMSIPSDVTFDFYLTLMNLGTLTALCEEHYILIRWISARSSHSAKRRWRRYKFDT